MFSEKNAKEIYNDIIRPKLAAMDKRVKNAKKDLVDFKIVLSLPGVITGRDYRIHWPENIPVISVPFSSSVGAFTLNVSLRDAE